MCITSYPGGRAGIDVDPCLKSGREHSCHTCVVCNFISVGLYQFSIGDLEQRPISSIVSVAGKSDDGVMHLSALGDHFEVVDLYERNAEAAKTVPATRQRASEYGDLDILLLESAIGKEIRHN